MPRIDMKQFFQSRLARTVSLRNDIVEVHLFQVMYLSVITIQLSNQPLQKATVLNIFWCIRGHAEADENKRAGTSCIIPDFNSLWK